MDSETIVEPDLVQMPAVVKDLDPAGLLEMDPQATRPLGVAKQEKFATLVASGKAVMHAYAEAGYAPHPSNCYKLAKEPKVARRIEWLKRKAAERSILSRETVTGRLLELADASQALETAAGYNVSRQAVMDAAQINGLVVNRSETRKIDDFDGLSPHERAYLKSSLDRLLNGRKKHKVSNSGSTTGRQLARNPPDRETGANPPLA